MQTCRFSCIQLFRERLSEKSAKRTRQSWKVVWVTINILSFAYRTDVAAILQQRPAVPGNVDERDALAAAAVYMSPKTIQHCVFKCLSTEEVKACTKFRKTKNSSLCIRTWNLKSWKQYVYQQHMNYVPDYFSGLSRALLCFFPTTYFEIAVYLLPIGQNVAFKDEQVEPSEVLVLCKQSVNRVIPGKSVGKNDPWKVWKVVFSDVHTRPPPFLTFALLRLWNIVRRCAFYRYWLGNVASLDLLGNGSSVVFLYVVCLEWSCGWV